ncbi:histone-like nucleoid-structuring protein Lsr2 [Dactylosporangium sp. CA-139066]|uniref:histone-like nucleoid-structuring protein Lsr2 n=1 Tax=Dactylosporangium sp. CA-139066 TaxID=3239930 RepID=UPI003D90461A
MAKRIVHEHVDDLDGTPAAETVRFGLDRVQYEIDLSARHAEQLRDALAPFIGAGRRVRSGPRPLFQPNAARTHAARAAGREENRTIREWAAGQGIEVPRLGRLKREIVEQYRAAHAADNRPAGAGTT